MNYRKEPLPGLHQMGRVHTESTGAQILQHSGGVYSLSAGVLAMNSHRTLHASTSSLSALRTNILVNSADFWCGSHFDSNGPNGSLNRIHFASGVTRLASRPFRHCRRLAE